MLGYNFDKYSPLYIEQMRLADKYAAVTNSFPLEMVRDSQIAVSNLMLRYSNSLYKMVDHISEGHDIPWCEITEMFDVLREINSEFDKYLTMDDDQEALKSLNEKWEEFFTHPEEI